MQRREFSFVIRPKDSADDIYSRYRSYPDKRALQRALTTSVPRKIDLGAVYNIAPSRHNAVDRCLPMEKELVFDIDISDYDDVRTCCKDAAICPRCWPLMNAAVRVLDASLREDFGFRHVLWVYSGRRGVHGWVCDPEVKKYDNESRSAVANSLSLVVGGAGNTSDRVTPKRALFPDYETRAFNILEPVFLQFAKDQGLFENEQGWKKVLDQIPSPEARESLHNLWADRGDSDRSVERCWKDIANVLSRQKRAGYPATSVLAKIVFTFTYPRLDINVSKQVHHLLKSPFCVHPSTGCVCVPIDPKHASDFDPSTVPTLSQLLNDLDSYDGKPHQTHGTHTQPLTLTPALQNTRKLASNNLSTYSSTS